MSEDSGGTTSVSDAPAAEGVHVYCIIESAEPRAFGNIGIGGRGGEAFTVHFLDLAAVVSRTPLMGYDPTRENALTHEHVQEIVMNEHGFTPVPMSFGTLFKTHEDTVEFLNDTHEALSDVLQKMKGKLEVRLQGQLGPRGAPSRDRVGEREDPAAKAEIQTNSQSSTYFARMQLGRLVERALADRSDSYVRSTTTCGTRPSRRARTRSSATR
ncbi:MAG TPA: GvpL/GvpF family gas vesicle protein [Candidatus Limnocylindria bacterium]|nr:GvpL/GvpF family gas vesicle protein [Candidatus Limnocylindria bacterium]